MLMSNFEYKATVADEHWRNEELQWARRLREKRCITYGSHGKYGYHGGAIMPLGKLINDWCISQNIE